MVAMTDDDNGDDGDADDDGAAPDDAAAVCDDVDDSGDDGSNLVANKSATTFSSKITVSRHRRHFCHTVRP